MIKDNLPHRISDQYYQYHGKRFPVVLTDLSSKTSKAATFAQTVTRLWNDALKVGEVEATTTFEEEEATTILGIEDCFVGLVEYQLDNPFSDIYYIPSRGEYEALSEVLSISLINKNKIVEFLEKYGPLYKNIKKTKSYNSKTSQMGGDTVYSRYKEYHVPISARRSGEFSSYCDTVDEILRIKTICKLWPAIKKKDMLAVLNCLLVLGAHKFAELGNSDDIHIDGFFKDPYVLAYGWVYPASDEERAIPIYFTQLKIDYDKECAILNNRQIEYILSIPERLNEILFTIAKDELLKIINANIPPTKLSVNRKDGIFLCDISYPSLKSVLYHEIILNLTDGTIWKQCQNKTCIKSFSTNVDSRKIYCSNSCARAAAQSEYRSRKKINKTSFQEGGN